MNKSSGSYKHQDETLEWQRLIQQFRDEWGWEKRVLAELGINPKNPNCMRALSYGCGIGIDALTLREESYAPYVEGWDINAASVQEANNRYGSDTLVFRKVDLSNEPAPGVGQFDLIYLRLVLLHIKVKDVPKLLEQCRNLLNGSGCLVIDDVDKEKGIVVPTDHEFGLISQEVQKYLIRCGNSPKIGSLVPDILAELGLRNIESRIVENQLNFEETQEDLSYSKNIADESKPDQRLIPMSLWENACKNDVQGFKRTTVRVITKGQK